MTNLIKRLIGMLLGKVPGSAVPRILTTLDKPLIDALNLRVRMAESPNRNFKVVCSDLNAGTITYAVNDYLWFNPGEGTITMKVDGLAFHYVEAGVKKVLK